MRTPLAVVLTVLVTIPLTTLAQQEATPCAWVSWIKWRSDATQLTDRWELQDALKSQAECLDFNRQRWQTTKAQTTGPFVVRVDGIEGRILSTTYKEGRFMTMEYFCVPSSIDPRPR